MDLLSPCFVHACSRHHLTVFEVEVGREEREEAGGEHHACGPAVRSQHRGAETEGQHQVHPAPVPNQDPGQHNAEEDDHDANQDLSDGRIAGCCHDELGQDQADEGHDERSSLSVGIIRVHFPSQDLSLTLKEP